MQSIKIAVIGAGSRSFGPAVVRDVFLSEELAKRGVELVLMDIRPEHLTDIERYSRDVRDQLGRAPASIWSTTDLERAVDGAAFVVTAIDAGRFFWWQQDFHIARKYGFRQVFGENGGPGGLFHALRNMGPTVEIARAMERLCPDAPLLNFSNPEHKLCEAVSRLTKIAPVGLCHGVFMGVHQIATMLGLPPERLDTAACGINHFTWFQTIRDRETGEDLYPKLREAEAKGDWLSDWHEMALGRILFRRFGLWPSPAANHYGEYIGWADEFVASELQFFHDPAEGPPWERGETPEWLYSLTGEPTRRPWLRQPAEPGRLEDHPLRESGELAVPVIEALGCGVRRELAAVNVPNRGAIPNLPDDMIVEVPAVGDASGLHAVQMEPLPEAAAALLRTQGSIHKLLVEAFAEKSKSKLLQALLIDPTVNSHQQAARYLDEMLELQKDVLPELG